MILKQTNQVLTYKIEPMVSEYKLLKDYNIHKINKAIRYKLEEIEAMYELSMSHVEEDGNDSLTSMSLGVEKIVIEMTEQRQRLEVFEKTSAKRLSTLKRIIAKYSPRDRQIIKRYFKKGVFQPDDQTIKKLRRDLYRIERLRLKRLELVREYQRDKEMKEYVNNLKDKMEMMI